MDSICQHTRNPGRLSFHAIGGSSDDWQLKDLAPSCSKGGAKLLLYSIEEMTRRVESEGYSPAWLWEPFGGNRTRYSIRPAAWDHSPTHNNPFNILRFYLPQIAPFKDMKQLLFMDDDIIFQGDVADTWDTPIEVGNIMTASCHNWVWGDCDRFDSSTSLTYLDVPYLGFGRIGRHRTLKVAACASESDKECIPEGLLELLANESAVINGRDHAVTAESLRHTKAWNYGFNKFDLNAWRRHDITNKFVSWMELNRKHMLFPETSLSYGLGIAMLTKLGRVQCFDGQSEIVQGLGFVGPKDMRGAGHYRDELRRSFGLHFNGPHKPWDPSGGNPYAKIFLAYAESQVREAFGRKDQDLQALRRARAATNSTSFVVLTDPRSGSEWFMELLDQHPEICASGEADDGVVGFPREALIPARYGHTQKHPLALLDYSPRHRHLGLLGVKRARARAGAFATLQEAFRSSSWAAEDLAPQTQKSVEQSGSGLEQSELGFQTCQTKAGCSWGKMAGLIWHVASHPDLCNASHGDLEAYGVRLGFGPHLGMLCQLSGLSRWELAQQGLVANASTSEVVGKSFAVFFRHQMRESLSINDGGFGSALEKRSILPCRCPRSAVVAGQKMMHDWIGDLPIDGAAAADWRERPYDVNYNADNATRLLGAPYYDLIGTMLEVGTKAIIFNRENLLARFVSLEAAKQTSIYHCEDEDCVRKASSTTITVDVPHLIRFVRWNIWMHKRNKATMEDSGIPTLNLGYAECQADARRCLDSVTKFLGVESSASPKDLAENTKTRRTTGSLRDKILNVDEVRAALKEEGHEEWLLDEMPSL